MYKNELDIRYNIDKIYPLMSWVLAIMTMNVVCKDSCGEELIAMARPQQQTPQSI